MKITIDLDHDDFEQLRTNSMQWAGDDWRDQANRFRVITSAYWHKSPFVGAYQPDQFSSVRGGDTAVTWSFHRAYWFTDTTSMILARSYLTAIGQPHQVLADEWNDGHEPFVIVTDYETPS